VEVRINAIVGLNFCTIQPNKIQNSKQISPKEEKQEKYCDETPPSSKQKKKKEKNNSLTSSMHIPIQNHDGLSPYSTQQNKK